MLKNMARGPAWYTVIGLVCAAVFISYIDRTNISVGAIAMQAQFGWSETQKGLVLSSFFVGYLLFMAASGSLANRYGGRIVLGLAVIWWSAWTLLTPPAALVSLPAVVVARIALGLGEAAVFPASINIIARWVPVFHRSRAVALVTSTIYLGTIVALPASGWLAHEFGWPMPFYAFGAVGFVWAIAWYLGSRDGHGVVAAASVPANAATRAAVPWRRLLGTPAVWAIIVGHFSANWLLYLMLAWLPSYFKTTFGATLASAGVLSMAPWIAAFVSANTAGFVADRMIRAGRSVTFVRKLMQVGGLLVSALFLLQLPAAGSLSVALALMCGAAATMSLCIAGFAPNSFDIAPRYADVIWGISNSFATLPGIVGVFITGWLVDRTGSFAAPFYLSAAVSAAGAVVFLVLASGERQID